MSVTLHTSSGDIKIELHCDLVPKTCKNFLALCASKYYDGTIFHRVIKQFIMQGGDPTETGKGGASIYGKYFDDEFVDALQHSQRGVVAMANKGLNTNGSQFYIAFAQHPHLDNVNTVFGRVIHGMDVIDAIEKVNVDNKYRPVTPVCINSVTIHSNPIAESES